MNNLDWNDLRYFLAVAEHGSLSKAAKRLGSNQPTVGRHIDALEAAMGLRLFQRTRSGLNLTQEGTRLLEHAQKVRDEVGHITRLSGENQAQPQGAVRLALPEGLCNDIVVPNLNRFHRRYPLLKLILQVSSRAANLTRGEADVAIRLFRPTEASLVVRQLGVMEMGLCTSPGYVKRHGLPRTESALKKHFAIAYGDELAPLPENQWLLERVPSNRIRLQSDSTTTRRIATEAGLGISVQPRKTIGGSNRLVPVLERVSPSSHPIWLVYHSDLKDLYRVRVVVDFLSSLFS